MLHCLNTNPSNYIPVARPETSALAAIELHGRGDKDSNAARRFFLGMTNTVAYGYPDCSVHLLRCMVLFPSNRTGIKTNPFRGRLRNLVEVSFAPQGFRLESSQS